MHVRTESILVPFRGEGSGTAELTWGQWHNWPKMRDYPSVFNMGGAVPCPPDTTIADFVDIVRFMMGQYQALRTRLRFDAAGTPSQVVVTSGRLPLEIVEVSDEEDPTAVAHAIEARYQHTVFDSEFEWPVRIAVVRQHGKSTHSVVMVNHLAVDAYSLDLLAAGFGSVADRVADDFAPLVQAGWQGGKSGRRTSVAALRSWERVLRGVPFDRFGSCGDPRQPRYWQGAYRSPAGYLAVRAIADRDQADTAAVVLAAIAVSLARVTGNALSVWQLVVSNRFRPGLATAVGPVSQTGLCAIDLADITFREAVVRARAAILSAGMNGYHDPRARDELLARLAAERGRATDITCVVNDRRRPKFDRPLADRPAADEIVAAAGRGELRWDFTTDRPSDNFYVHVNHVPDMLDYAMCADTHRVGVDELVACLRGVEEVVVAAALDADATTGVSTS